MLKLLATLALLAIPAALTGARPVSIAAPSDSVEYVIHWPAATSPYGPVTRYKVVITQGPGTWTHDSVAGLKDSVNVLKPGYGSTVYPFGATVTPYYAGAAGAPISVNWSYQRPSPAPSFPAGALVAVDSSKIVRP